MLGRSFERHRQTGYPVPQLLLRQCVFTLLLVLINSTTQADDKVTHRDTVLTDSARTKVSQHEIDRASAWSLNESEWRRYQRLLQGIRGSVSPATLSPIEVLGIHARDATERRRYAERWAIAMHEDARRILQFQHAYDAAAERLFPGEPLIDTAVLNGGAAPVTELRRTDRIVLRIALDCPSCDAVLAKALDRLDDVAGLDVYVVNATSAQQTAVREWAGAQGIQPDWVRSRRVTLNIADVVGDDQIEHGPFPTLHIRRGEALLRLAYAVL